MSKTEFRKLSIIFLGTQMTVGGAQRLLLDQASWFYKNDYRVTVAFIYDKDNLHSKWQDLYPFLIVNLKAHQPQKNIFKNFYLLMSGIFRILSLFRENRFDVIETFTPHSNLFGIPLAFIAGIPVRIATHHGDVFYNSPRWFYKLHGWLLNNGMGSRLVAVSEEVYKIAIEKEEIRPDKIKVILNGINIIRAEKPLTQIRSRLRADLGLNPDDFIYLSVGRLTQQKGHTYLLDAVPEVLARYPENTIFIFAGDGDLRDSLEIKAADLGIGSNVYFLGTRSDVPNLLYLANVFVLPSLWEGLPLALLEAMSAGLPVVATRVEGVVTVIKHGKNGYLVPAKNSESLATALLEIRDNEAARKLFSKSNKNLVERDFTIEKMCREYEDLFQSIYQRVRA
jgi:glycosyltransferase involved in cell wall biosynthesis